MITGRPAWPAARSAGSEPGLMLPAWRRLLESRWRQRLAAVTSLSLAYHEAEERTGGGLRADGQAEARTLRRLRHGAVAARRALFDTEEALARLSAGRYGRCEQCAGPIPAARLTLEPEARYCGRCALSTGPSRPAHPRSAPAGYP
jgi:RNA polymerase-binding transcription factor DksA